MCQFAIDRSPAVIVHSPVPNSHVKMAFVEWNQEVETFATKAAVESLAHRVRLLGPALAYAERLSAYGVRGGTGGDRNDEITGGMRVVSHRDGEMEFDWQSRSAPSRSRDVVHCGWQTGRGHAVGIGHGLRASLGILTGDFGVFGHFVRFLLRPRSTVQSGRGCVSPHCRLHLSRSLQRTWRLWRDPAGLKRKPAARSCA
jgi:hypothetical protein